MPQFIELRARSAFSFHRGASHPESLIRRAAELGMPALALCDRDGVYGSARAHYAAAELRREQGTGIRALVGAEITLEGSPSSVLPLLVRTRTGYQNLCQMLTRAKLRGLSEEYAQENPFLNPRKDGRIRPSELEEFACSRTRQSSDGPRWWEPGETGEGRGGGLLALTGGHESAVRQALAQGDLRGAERELLELVRIFGRENVVVEITRRRVRGEDWANRRLLELAETHHLLAIATNAPLVADRQGRPLADAFACLRNHVHLDTAGRLLAPNAEAFLKGPREMATLFPDRPDLLENTLRVADRIGYTLCDLGYRFPEFPAPEGHDEASFLREQTYLGARGRYGRITGKIRRQLDHELALITKLGFCGYFLIVKDIVEFARLNDFLVQGRGSAANSAVCYCLGITAVDAIGQKLLFERFLSEGRKSWPDIDLDLPSGERREAVIQSVFAKYAPRGAAMTANVITYRGRSAMREMGKALDIPEDILGRFSDTWGSSRISDPAELRARILESGMSSEHPRLPALLHLFHAVHRLPRHLGQHSGGMIISDRPLDLVVPLENASMEGRRVVQWDKDDCEDLGIIKVDLLGLGMLAAMQDSVELCAERGRPVDLATIPKDDKATYDLLCKADTIGVFQVESRAQMATLPRLRPRVFYDLAVEVAIIRPGPIMGKMVHPYLDRRQGKAPIDFIDDRFKPALERTLGVPLFQEQVLQMAMIAADFDGSEAEELRRAISFHRSEERMAKVMGKLCSAMEERGVPTEVQQRIAESIQSFAMYGFPESHAISFALIAYASAWLKVHRPAEFFVGLLNNQPMGFYSRATLVRDAKAHGIRVRPVDVCTSDLLCTVESDHAIRLGLGQIRGMERDLGARIVALRQAAGPFRSLEDFLQRVRPNRESRRTLAKIGALNSLADVAHRRDALWRTEAPLLREDDLFTYGKRRAEKAAQPPNDQSLNSPLPPMTPAERLQADYDGLSLTTGPHPMAYLRDRLPADPPIWRAVDLPQGKPEQLVCVAGLVICRQRPGTAKGHVFLSLEDETGIANAFVPGPTFQRLRLVLTQEPFLLLRGRLQIESGVTSIYTLHAQALPSATTTLGPGQSHDFR